jgi:hypothetical protein
MGPAALLAFAVLKGALEDHFFLYLLVPSVIALAAAAPRVRSLRLPVRRRGTLAALLAAALLAGIVSDAVVWGRLRSRPDDGYQHLVTYLANDLPRDSIVGVDLGDPLWQAARVTDRSAALQGQAVHLANQLVGPWHSKKSLRAHRVRYMIVNQKIVAEHLATGSTTFYQWLPRHARLVFSVKEDSYDRLSVYEMPASYWSP